MENCCWIFIMNYQFEHNDHWPICFIIFWSLGVKKVNWCWYHYNNQEIVSATKKIKNRAITWQKVWHICVQQMILSVCTVWPEHLHDESMGLSICSVKMNIWIRLCEMPIDPSLYLYHVLLKNCGILWKFSLLRRKWKTGSDSVKCQLIRVFTNIMNCTRIVDFEISHFFTFWSQE